MMLAAAAVFTYYTVWALLLVRTESHVSHTVLNGVYSPSSTRQALYMNGSRLGNGQSAYQHSSSSWASRLSDRSSG